jgi:uncharacterized protein YdaU (DUF1376 family)|tara:strand:- start:23 stop:379 length:357 start_codon:yes stop_codon:yes gene_type:complete
MSKQTSPAFPLYADDWLGSSAIDLMSPAEEGAYIRLLCHAWNSEDCGLPDDDKKLAIHSRLGKAWRNGSGAKIRENFIVKDGRLYNLRLLEIWTEQKEYREQKAKAGKKGADARWHNQ